MATAENGCGGDTRSGVSGKHGAQDGEVMAGAATKDEEVPNGVGIGDALGGVENDSSGVEQPAGQ